MSQKKYLLLTSYTWPESSGSGINAYNFANALISAGHQATILSFRRSFQKYENNLIIRIPYFSSTLFGKIVSLPIILLYYLSHIVRADVLLIYGNRIIAWEIALIFARIFKKKIIFRSLLLGVDDVDTILKKKKIKRWIYLFLLKWIDCYYSINKTFSESWKTNLKVSKVLFESPQGVDTTRYYPRRKTKQAGFPNDAYILASIGFLIKRKGLRMVFNTLSKIDLNFRYFCIGEYLFNKKHFLRKTAEEAKSIVEEGIQLLGNNVIFTGFVSNIEEYLCQVDALIHGESREVPNVVMEAMASGVPVICSYKSISCSSFLIDRVNCLSYSNEQELQQAIIDIKTNKKLREKVINNALDYITKHASLFVVISKLNLFLFNQVETE